MTQDDYISALTLKAKADKRVRGAWLEGSFGRDIADRYSDIDAHFLLSKDDLGGFQQEAEAWLSEIEPLVLFDMRFDGHMINGLTESGLRLDLWLHGGESITVESGKTHLLLDACDCVLFASPSESSVAASAELVQRQIREFWRCISLLPSVIGRQEHIVAFMGVTLEVNLLQDILLTGNGIVRDRGAKVLNTFLPPDLRQEIEAALDMPNLSSQSLADAHRKLARLMQAHGPAIAERNDIPYPKLLETAVLAYVERELALLGLQA